MGDLQFDRPLEQLARHARQAGAAIALRGVENRPVGVFFTVDFQGFLDQEHTRGRDGGHLA